MVASLRHITGTGDIHSLSGSYGMVVEIQTYSLGQLYDVLDAIRQVHAVA